MKLRGEVSSRLRFDPEAHIYSLDGTIRLPSVTEIIREARMTPFWNSPPGMKAQIGTWIHDMLKLHFQGTLDDTALSPAMRDILQDVKSWAMDVSLAPIDIETPIFHPWYFYAGKPDLIALVNGIPAVIDWKYGDPRPSDEVQIGGYVEMVRRCYEGADKGPFVGMSIYLKTIATKPHDVIYGKRLEEATADFLAAQRCYRWRKENNLIERRKDDAGEWYGEGNQGAGEPFASAR